MERTVKTWADEVLYHLRGNHYELQKVNGELISEIRAVSDPEAIEKSALVGRDAWERRQGIEKGKRVLSLLEGSNKGAMFECLDDDELHRLQGMLFVWSDLAKREIEQRRSAWEKRKGMVK